MIIYRETAYIDTTGYTDEQKQALEDYGKEEQAKYADVTCRTVRYEMNEANSRFVITVEYTNLDKEENYSAVYAAGLLTSSGPYSMQVTTTLELEGGFIMKCPPTTLRRLTANKQNGRGAFRKKRLAPVFCFGGSVKKIAEDTTL